MEEQHCRMEKEVKEGNNNGNKIILTYLNGRGYVFNVDDYMKIRTQYRIVGSLVGTSSRHGWNANENVLPVELTVFETRLLMEKGVAVLASKKDALLKKPTDEELLEYKSAQNSLIANQREAQKAEKLREVRSNMDRILKGKRKKLERDGLLDQAKALTPEIVLDEINKTFELTPGNVLLEIPLAYNKEHCVEVLKLPKLAEKSHVLLKYRVFCDIWLRGKDYFITPGESFGCDFLVYPGDPLLFHAKYIVVILQEDPNSKKVTLKPLDLVIKTRLAVNVNKTCVFAYVNSSNNEIQYQIVEWEGDPDKEVQKF